MNSKKLLSPVVIIASAAALLLMLFLPCFGFGANAFGYSVTAISVSGLDIISEADGLLPGILLIIPPVLNILCALFMGSSSEKTRGGVAAFFAVCGIVMLFVSKGIIQGAVQEMGGSALSEYGASINSSLAIGGIIALALQVIVLVMGVMACMGTGAPRKAAAYRPIGAAAGAQKSAPKGGSKFCPGCGAPVQSGKAFCSNCGRKLI
ncbi:MAG: zinc ribbon domain-containing protein [Clostridiales bacterium]|nr:zinc ribbon domain-containing protein [Clostridiales bacterium]